LESVAARRYLVDIRSAGSEAMVSKQDADVSASDRITRRIAELGDWRGATLARMRALFHEADPAIVEEWKWMGTPIWSRDGIISTGESYKQYIKLTFAKGAALKDPKKLFNSSLDGNVRRAIDIREGETIDATAFKALVREAIALNVADKARRAAKKAPVKAATKALAKAATKAPAKAANKAPAKAATKAPARAAKPAIKKAVKKAPAKKPRA
jgi:hypothetical protein